MSHYKLIEFESGLALAKIAASQWLDQIAAESNRQWFVGLSGGRAAIPLFQEIARQAQIPQCGKGENRIHSEYGVPASAGLAFDPIEPTASSSIAPAEAGTPCPLRQVPLASDSMTQSDSAILSRVHFFWVDERCVPADDDQSNYRLADLHLFKPLNISRANIHRICGELEPADAAKKAIAELQAIAPQNDQRAPILDWAFLGMGEDGHIGSLFPELSSKALDSMPLYAPVTASKPPPNRIALNLATLIRARHAWVFITGPGKDKALAESLSPHGSTPLGRLLARRDKTLIWRAN